MTTKNFCHFISTGEFLFIRMAFTSQPDFLRHNALAHKKGHSCRCSRSIPLFIQYSRCDVVWLSFVASRIVARHVASQNAGKLCRATFAMHTANQRAPLEQTITKQTPRHITLDVYNLHTYICCLLTAKCSLTNCWKPVQLSLAPFRTDSAEREYETLSQ